MLKFRKQKRIKSWSVQRPRTREDFNKWYSENNDDPWGYKNYKIQSRLNESLDFILNYLPQDFSGNIIEIGAFRGDFSILLCNKYKNAKIYINDISDIALKYAKEKTSSFNNVSYFMKDLLKISIDDIDDNSKDTVLILLECIYYLSNEEREIALKNLRRSFPNASIFISAPMSGGVYFLEYQFLYMMKNCGYRLNGIKVLNLKKLSFLRTILKPVANRSKKVREKVARQVIFYFT